MPLIITRPVAAQLASRSVAAEPVAHASVLTTASSQPAGMTSERLRQLMRPSFRLGFQWLAEADDVELSTYDARVTMPLYPIFGPPPPMFSLGFEYTDLSAAAVFDLAGELYETSIGLSWMRRRNDRWSFRWMLGAANATDGDNQSSDAWQFRGGGFAIYQPNERWTWTFGAIALGRNDIPVVPAIGFIYQPNPCLRFDASFPRPRASLLLADNGIRQQWGYIGAGLEGGTWGYQRNDGTDDQLTYRDWRLVLGWESTPRRESGMPFALGRKLSAEVGYAFGRRFEFESDRSDFEIQDALLIQIGTRF
ncbi:hypothetical protein Enr13x_50330 [Stieleria neptunia]|uniref:DUF6268 domain-containing protein n=2 Tax=Stieleria neptunia TaxID=2527979 RepID=A0A518HWC8_9BACT|nr:hypothetical protein Enr13x_50330 [Stieleria neptunia]